MFKRSTIGFFGIIAFILLLVKRGSLKYFLSSIRQEGFDPKNILIIGSHKRAERIIHEFKEHGEYGLRIRSILDPDSSRIGLEVDGIQVTGDMSIFKETLKDLDIDEVFCFPKRKGLRKIVSTSFVYYQEIRSISFVWLYVSVNKLNKRKITINEYEQKVVSNI